MARHQLNKKLKRRARQSNLKCTVSSSQLKTLLEIRDYCPMCGCSFVKEENDPRAPSVDRLDSKSGYIWGNLTVVCRTCNSAKSQYDQGGEELLLSSHRHRGEGILRWINHCFELQKRGALCY